MGSTVMDGNAATAAQCNPHTPAGKAMAARIADLLNESPADA
jgi:hypothetical protein